MPSSANLRNSVYEHIQSRLLSGALPPGTMISELSLAKDIGVSRTPVREAIQQLQNEGFVECVPRYGTVVCTPSLKDIAELFELRLALETHAAAKAATVITPETLATLEKLTHGLKRIGDELQANNLETCDEQMFRRYLALDMGFHMLLIRVVDNRRIEKQVHDSRVFTRVFCSRREDQCSLDALARAYNYHNRILEGIRNRDPEKARRAMAEHIEFSRDRSLAYYHDKFGDHDNMHFETLIMPKDLLKTLKELI